VIEVGEPGEGFPVLDGRLRVIGEERISGGNPLGPGLLSGTTLPYPAVHLIDLPSVIPEIEGVGHGAKLRVELIALTDGLRHANLQPSRE
jgi:hypothetical protein